MTRYRLLIIGLCTMIFPTAASTQEQSAAELAKKLANPIASLISLPLQNNADFGIGEFEGSRNTLNIQLVIPIALNENVNLITRAIIAVISQFSITGGREKYSGPGDSAVFLFPNNRSTVKTILV